MPDPAPHRATIIRQLPPTAAGATQILWRMDPPLESHPLVVTSAVVVMYSGPETYIFAADETGLVTNWSELDGSFKGGLDHELAIANAGYEVVR